MMMQCVHSVKLTPVLPDLLFSLIFGAMASYDQKEIQREGQSVGLDQLLHACKCNM
jgi:hypothetical protein